MLASSLITDQNYCYDNVENLGHSNIKGINTNQQETSTLSSITTHTKPSLISQTDLWPHQTTTQSNENTSLESFIQSNQSNLTNLNFLSSDINTKEWQTSDGTTESILKQALPGSFAVPIGWRSEIIRSSSPISNDIGTKLIDSSTNFIGKHEEYKILNIPPVISPRNFSSTNEANRIINEISSSNILPSTSISSSISEHSNPTVIVDRSKQEQKTILTKDQQTLITNIENQQPPPLILHKTLPNNTVTYQQNISVRYLQPPTPPPPGPVIIREVRPPPPPPQSPVQIRQRPPPPPTPPPIVIRERPPPAPPQLPSQVVERLLPPPPRPPRRMIVERFGPCPPKPADVIIERWLPYKRRDRRRIFFERAPASYRPPQEPNLLILHDQPHARIDKEFINQGVIRADPLSYLQRYGAELGSIHTNSRYAYLVDEAARALPPPQPLLSTNDYHGYHTSYPPSPSPHLSTIWDRMRSASPIPHHDYPTSYPPSPSPHLSTIWDRMRSVSPIPYSTSYHHDYSRYDLPYSYSTQSSYRDHLNPYHSYNDNATYRGNYRTMVDVTPLWNRHCSSLSSHSYLPSYQFSSSSFYPPKTIQVNSDGELHHVLSDLTNGHVPSPLRSY